MMKYAKHITFAFVVIAALSLMIVLFKFFHDKPRTFGFATSACFLALFAAIALEANATKKASWILVLSGAMMLFFILTAGGIGFLFEPPFIMIQTLVFLGAGVFGLCIKPEKDEEPKNSKEGLIAIGIILLIIIALLVYFSYFS